MLVKFTVIGGCEPINAQARGEVLSSGLQLLRVRDAKATTAMRRSIREDMDENTSFTAKQIARTGSSQAESARPHGDRTRAQSLERTADQLKSKWKQ